MTNYDPFRKRQVSESEGWGINWSYVQRKREKETLDEIAEKREAEWAEACAILGLTTTPDGIVISDPDWTPPPPPPAKDQYSATEHLAGFGPARFRAPLTPEGEAGSSVSSEAVDNEGFKAEERAEAWWDIFMLGCVAETPEERDYWFRVNQEGQPQHVSREDIEPDGTILEWAGGKTRRALDVHSEPVLTEAESRMLHLSEAGHSIREIAVALNNEGYQTAKGGPWQPSTIHKILNRINPPECDDDDGWE